MQKYNPLPEIIQKLREISLQISRALENEIIGEPENFLLVQNLYGQREKLMADIELWLESSEGKSYIAQNRETWNNFFREIAELEKRHIQKLGAATATAKQKLRNVVQNRAILLYTKG